jgi:hypothetical protein
MKAPSYFQQIAPRGRRAAPPAPLPRLQPAPPLFRPTPGPLAFVETLEERVVGSRPVTRSAAPPSATITAPGATAAPPSPQRPVTAQPPLADPISRAPSAIAMARPTVPEPSPKPTAGSAADHVATKPAAPLAVSAALPPAAPADATRARPSGARIDRIEATRPSPTPLAPPADATVARGTPVADTAHARTRTPDRDDGLAAAPRSAERRGVEPSPEPPRPAPASTMPPPSATMPRIAPEPPAPRPPRAAPARAPSAPSIHIGLLEVRVTTPAPTPLPSAARPAARVPAGRAAAAPARLARGLGVFGLGQS